VGCGACAEIHPSFFIIRDEKAWLLNHEQFIPEEHGDLVFSCPFRAITIE